MYVAKICLVSFLLTDVPDGFILSANRWDFLPLDKFIEPLITRPWARSWLADAGYLGYVTTTVLAAEVKIFFF